MIRDRDAFVFYSALVIGVLTLFIGHDGEPDTAASLASSTVQAAPARDSAALQPVLQPVRGAGQPLVLAVSHKTY